MLGVTDSDRNADLEEQNSTMYLRYEIDRTQQSISLSATATQGTDGVDGSLGSVGSKSNGGTGAFGGTGRYAQRESDEDDSSYRPGPPRRPITNRAADLGLEDDMDLGFSPNEDGSGSDDE